MTFIFEAKVTASLSHGGYTSISEQFFSGTEVSDILAKIPNALKLDFGFTPPDSLVIEIYKDYANGED